MKTKFVLIFLCIHIGVAYSQIISKDITLSDNRIVDINHIFLDGEDCMLYLDESANSACWDFSLYASADFKESFSVLRAVDKKSFEIKINENDIDWSEACRFEEHNDSSIYFKGVVRIYKDDKFDKKDIKDSVVLAFNLLPSKPNCGRCLYL